MIENKVEIFEEILNSCFNLESEFDLISESRKATLSLLADYVKSKIEANEELNLIVICTHNSRRSHMGQLWLALGAELYGIPKMNTFSGGTEATAFNPRAVRAVQEAGFNIETENPEADNPIYKVKWIEEMVAYPAFSKRYEDNPNPKDNFGAIMVCTSADEACPIVKGADFRLALPFQDPKKYDDSPLEAKMYTERFRQIGREILFALSLVKTT